MVNPPCVGMTLPEGAVELGVVLGVAVGHEVMGKAECLPGTVDLDLDGLVEALVPLRILRVSLSDQAAHGRLQTIDDLLRRDDLLGDPAVASVRVGGHGVLLVLGVRGTEGRQEHGEAVSRPVAYPLLAAPPSVPPRL